MMFFSFPAGIADLARYVLTAPIFLICFIM